MNILGFLLFTSFCFLCRKSKQRPNILLILAMIWDMVMSVPESKIPTPHCNRLAKEGMLFTDAHSPSEGPVTYFDR